MQSAFILSHLARPKNVLGIDLVPLTLGHVYILYAVDSPFVTGEPYAKDDFIFAVYLCSRDWRESIGLIQLIDKTGLPDDDFVKWSNTLNLYDESAKESLADYFSDYLKSPERFQKGDGNSTIKSPRVFYTAISLMHYLRLSEDQAWNMPVVKALSYLATMGEILGDTDLISDLEAQLINKLDK